MSQLARVEPGEAGFDPDRLSRVTRFVEDEIAAGRLPGAVLGIVRGGRIAHFEALGHRDPQRGVPMTADTLFWIASMTKPITTVGALLLHEQGRLVLDIPIGDHLPQFADRRVADLAAWPGEGAPIPTRAAARQPTILDLLRHTAGIPEGMLGDSPVHALYTDAVGDGMTTLTGPEYLDRLSGLPLLHDPGTTWHYGFGLDLLGLIIESIAGESLGAYLRSRVFEPLGMHDTTFGVPEDRRDRYAAAFPADPETGAPQELPDLSVAAFDSGGAGLVSTAADYLRFVQLLLAGGDADTGRLLGRKTVDYMLADQLDQDTDVRRLARPGWNPGHGFGLGLAVRRRQGGASTPGSVGEVTWPGAAGTNWWADPAEDLGVVFMAHTPSRIQSHYQQQIKALVLQALV
ncbi:serine hydrolase domain-containing protein [Solihabitans fulvus]|nr:serine hydrolase domain-containing protein [Solihabitans fulvus]